MDSVWAGFFKFSWKEIQKVIPEARVGYEGSDVYVSSWLADDYWELSHSMNLNNIYYRPFQAAVWKSFFSSQQDNLLGLGWFGGYGSPYNKKDTYITSFMPWFTLFKGANSFWIWHANPRMGSVTSPEFAFYDFFQGCLEAIREIKQGLDKALLRAERVTDIGIYYSPVSIHTTTFLNIPIQIDTNFQALTQLILDAGFQPRVYSYKEVIEGKLVKEKPKVLVLPLVFALSSQETSAIKKYVHSGGVLLADILPGTRDEYGRVLPKGRLDEVFGVEFSLPRQLCKLSSKKVESKFGMLSFFTGVYGREIIVKKGESKGKIGTTPVFIFNSYGRGKTILLNFTLDTYYGLRKNSWYSCSNFRKILKKIFSDVGVYPPVIAKPEVPGLEINRFKSGKIRYITLIQKIFEKDPTLKSYGEKNKKPISATISFSSPFFTYNILSKQFLGLSSQVNFEIQLGRPVIFALLPYEIKELKLSISPSRIEKGEEIKYSVKIITSNKSNPGEQIIFIQFFDPSGKEVECYRKKLAVKNNIVEEEKLALNDPSGRWTIIATDLISGKQTKSFFEVGERK